MSLSHLLYLYTSQSLCPRLIILIYGCILLLSETCYSHKDCLEVIPGLLLNIHSIINTVWWTLGQSLYRNNHRSLLTLKLLACVMNKFWSSYNGTSQWFGIYIRLQVYSSFLKLKCWKQENLASIYGSDQGSVCVGYMTGSEHL